MNRPPSDALEASSVELENTLMLVIFITNAHERVFSSVDAPLCAPCHEVTSSLRYLRVIVVVWGEMPPQ
jgi:hypothetical protein